MSNIFRTSKVFGGFLKVITEEGTKKIVFCSSYNAPTLFSKFTKEVFDVQGV